MSEYRTIDGAIINDNYLIIEELAHIIRGGYKFDLIDFETFLNRKTIDNDSNQPFGIISTQEAIMLFDNFIAPTSDGEEIIPRVCKIKCVNGRF